MIEPLTLASLAAAFDAWGAGIAEVKVAPA
jgi:hypothetical protein